MKTDLYPTPTSHSHSPEITTVNCILFFLEIFYLCVHTYTVIDRNIIWFLYKPDQTILKYFLNKFKALYNELICLLFVFSSFLGSFSLSLNEMLESMFCFVGANMHTKEHFIS